MQPYANLAGNSGVAAYAITDHAIAVRFAHGHRVYEYSHASAGREHVETMKRLARAGRGLSTYIARHVAEGYVRQA